MKRYIRAGYGAEPSANEYGKALEEGYAQMRDKFYPFEVTPAYMNRHSTSSTGYNIILPDDYDSTIWIADKQEYAPKGYKLYGPYSKIDGVNSWADLREDMLYTDQIFKNIEAIISYLYEDLDIAE